MSDTVKMKYTGPNAENDPRTIEVSEAEAKTLAETGLWSKAKSTKAKSDDKKEND